MKSPIFVAVFNSENRYFLMMTQEDSGTWVIHGFRTLKKGLNYFSGAYKKAHLRGYEASMSAAVNYIQFGPRIVEFANIDELKPYLKQPIELLRINADSGHYTVLELDAALMEPVYEKSPSPDLVPL